MKKTILIVLVLFAVIAMATTKVMGQDIDIETISFSNEIGCEIRYETVVLANTIATSDTLYVEFDDYEDNELARLMAKYENTFPSELGPDEPAVSVLLPDDGYFNVIFLQETEKGEILTFRILSRDGWLECLAEPGSEELIHLAGMIAFIQHLNEVSDN